MPEVRIRDSLKLGPRDYAILVKGVEVARFALEPNRCLAVAPASMRVRRGHPHPRAEPSVSRRAGSRPTDRQRAYEAGFSVYEPTAVLIAHLGELVRTHAHELLGRQETHALIEKAARTHPKLVEELTPRALSSGRSRKYCRTCSRERVSIRDMVSIGEALADAAMRIAWERRWPLPKGRPHVPRQHRSGNERSGDRRHG